MKQTFPKHKRRTEKSDERTEGQHWNENSERSMILKTQKDICVTVSRTRAGIACARRPVPCLIRFRYRAPSRISRRDITRGRKRHVVCAPNHVLPYDYIVSSHDRRLTAGTVRGFVKSLWQRKISGEPSNPSSMQMTELYSTEKFAKDV